VPGVKVKIVPVRKKSLSATSDIEKVWAAVSKTNDHCSAALGFRSLVTSEAVVVNPLRDVKVTSTPELLYCPLEMLTVAVPPDGDLHAVAGKTGTQPAVPVTASAWATGVNAKKTIKLTRVMRICMVASVKKAREGHWGNRLTNQPRTHRSQTRLRLKEIRRRFRGFSRNG
jgi:hypothetical protein